MSILFSPLTIRGVTARNRLWVSPMCQYSSVDGAPQEWHHMHLTQFATGGAGLVVAEATAVAPEGRTSPWDSGLWNDAQRDAWAPIVEAVHARGALAGIQLAHAGRKGSTWPHFAQKRGNVDLVDGGWSTIAPSPIPHGALAVPEEMSRGAIAEIVEGFAAAAIRAVHAGFDVIDIHGAHGYLLHQFLSPLSNHREDEYGGSLENRARLLLEVIAAVRAVAPEIALFVRFSATDWAEGGWEVDDTVAVARLAAALGADQVDVSSGGLAAQQQIVLGPGYQVPFAARVRREADVPVTAVGLIDSGTQAEAVLAAGDADAIMSAREWLRDPHFALRASLELGEDIDYWPPQYLHARPRPRPFS